jgi:formylglycine-generating enzyme required for sulfatase activity
MFRNVSVLSTIIVGLVACGSAPEQVTAKAPAPVVAVAAASNLPSDSPAACEDQGALAVAPSVPTSSAPVVASVPDKPADIGPSCNGRSGATNDCQGQSCCDRLGVPGGVVAYQRDGNATAESRVVKPFVLDKFEVTVGRFRAWVEAGQPTPKPGDVLYDDNAGRIVRWTKDAKVQDDKHLAGWQAIRHVDGRRRNTSEKLRLVVHCGRILRVGRGTIAHGRRMDIRRSRWR